MFSESGCGSCRVGQSILREIFDAIKANPIDGAHELLRGSEKLFMADGKAPTEEV